MDRVGEVEFFETNCLIALSSEVGTGKGFADSILSIDSIDPPATQHWGWQVQDLSIF